MVEPLVVSPSGVDAIALGDNAAFEHNGVLVQHDGIGAGDVGRSLTFVRDPRFVGAGFFAGEAPDGLTTVYGDPIPADVFVYWRDPDDPMAQEVLVGATKSAPDGTWRITGLNYNLRYVIRAMASGHDDVTVVGVQPSRTDVITYEGEFTNTEDFDGVAGEILITSGLPPFTATVIQPLPSGLFPVVSGRNLIIDGTTNADEVASFDVKVTSSNGAEKIIPLLQLVVGFKAPQNLASEVIIDDNVFSVALTWKVASSTQQVKVYRSETPFDMGDLPVPLAVLTGSATTYTDDDVVEDEAFYYMVSAEREGYVRYSVVVREVIASGDDPHWDKVSLLLHMDGADGSTTFTDSSAAPKTLTTYGSARISTAQSRFGGASARFDAGPYISCADSDAFNFAGVPWTIEFFVYWQGSSADVMSRRTNSDVYAPWEIKITSGGVIYLLASNASVNTWAVLHQFQGVALTADTFCHVALSGASGSISCYINGIKATNSATGEFAGVSSQPLYIGRGGDGALAGYLDEIRITKGVARYTANFTPPDKPFLNR